MVPTGSWRSVLRSAVSRSASRFVCRAATRRPPSCGAYSRSAWYEAIPDAEQRAAVLYFRNADYDTLDDFGVRALREKWCHNDDSAKVEVLYEGRSVLVRPFWVSIRINPDLTSELYITVLPVGEAVADRFVDRAQPQVHRVSVVWRSIWEMQAKYDGSWEFKQADRVSGSWRNYFVGLCGDLGFDWRETVIPNCLFHERRRVHDVLTLSHIGVFLADATRERILTHIEKIDALAEQKSWGRSFKTALVESRWGTKALSQHKIRL